MRTIYTVGYQGMGITQFMTLLLQAGVEILIDVRANPVSRMVGFSRRQLAAHCQAHGIEYRNFPSLGIPSHMRRVYLPGNRSQLFALYRQRLHNTISEMTELRAVCESKQAALLCYEADPATCHRFILAKELNPKGVIRDLRHEHVGEVACPGLG